MRDQSIRRPAFRQVYAHALLVAHLSGHLIASDHPAFERIWAALQLARDGDPDALDTLERELLRLQEPNSGAL